MSDLVPYPSQLRHSLSSTWLSKFKHAYFLSINRAFATGQNSRAQNLSYLDFLAIDNEDEVQLDLHIETGFSKQWSSIGSGSILP